MNTALRDYIHSKGKSIREWCESNHEAYESIRVLIYGDYTPSAKVAKRLSNKTGGEVSLEQLLFPKPKTQKPRKGPRPFRSQTSPQVREEREGRQSS